MTPEGLFSSCFTSGSVQDFPLYSCSLALPGLVLLSAMFLFTPDWHQWSIIDHLMTFTLNQMTRANHQTPPRYLQEELTLLICVPRVCKTSVTLFVTDIVTAEGLSGVLKFSWLWTM